MKRRILGAGSVWTLYGKRLRDSFPTSMLPLYNMPPSFLSSTVISCEETRPVLSTVEWNGPETGPLRRKPLFRALVWALHPGH